MSRTSSWEANPTLTKRYTNGHPGVSTMVFQTAGSNATQVVNEIDALLAELQAELPKGVSIAHLQSVNDFLFASIKEVIKTLIRGHSARDPGRTSSCRISAQRSFPPFRSSWRWSVPSASSQ